MVTTFLECHHRYSKIKGEIGARWKCASDELRLIRAGRATTSTLPLLNTTICGPTSSNVSQLQMLELISNLIGGVKEIRTPYPLRAIGPGRLQRRPVRSNCVIYIGRQRGPHTSVAVYALRPALLTQLLTLRNRCVLGETART